MASKHGWKLIRGLNDASAHAMACQLDDSGLGERSRQRLVKAENDHEEALLRLMVYVTGIEEQLSRWRLRARSEAMRWDTKVIVAWELEDKRLAEGNSP